MALQVSIPANQSRATSIQKMKNLVDYGLGIGQAATCVTYGDLATKLNVVAAALSLPTFDPANDNAGAIRAKVNAINTALGLDRDLDLSYRAAVGRYWANGGPLSPASQITDPHNDNRAMIQNAAGLWVPVAANALSVTDTGLWSYPARTNLSLQSRSKGTSPYAIIRGVVTPDVIAGIDGTMTGDLIECNSTNVNGTSVFQDIAGVTVATNYCYSEIVKRGNTDWVALMVRDVGNTNFRYVLFNLVTSAIVNASGIGTDITLVSSGIIDLGNGFYRPWIVVNAATITTLRHVLFVCDAANLGATVGINVYALHAQFEAGAFPSPAIFTTTTSLQRLNNAPVTTGLSAPNGIGIVCRWTQLAPTSGIFVIAHWDAGSTSERVTIYLNSNGDFRANVTSAGTGRDLALSPTAFATVGTDYTAAIVVANGFFQGRMVGQVQGGALAGTVYPSAASNLRYGHSNVGGVPGQINYQRAKVLELATTGTFDQARLDALYSYAQAIAA